MSACSREEKCKERLASMAKYYNNVSHFADELVKGYKEPMFDEEDY